MTKERPRQRELQVERAGGKSRQARKAAAEWAGRWGVGYEWGRMSGTRPSVGTGGKDSEHATHMKQNVLQPSKEFCWQTAVMVNWTVKMGRLASVCIETGGREKSEGEGERSSGSLLDRATSTSSSETGPKQKKGIRLQTFWGGKENNLESLHWPWIYF